MSNLTHEIVIESKSARSQVINNKTDEQSLIALNKAKSLVMAVWNSTSLATTEQLAEYYLVDTETVKKVYQRHHDEFKTEARNLTGKELQYGRDILSLPSKTSQALVFTARGALRVGLLLTQSEVAKNVRDVVLNVVESVPQILLENAFRELKDDERYENQKLNEQFMLLKPNNEILNDRNYVVQEFLSEAWGERKDQVRLIFETISKIADQNSNTFTLKQLRNVAKFSSLYKEEHIFVTDCIELMSQRCLIIGILRDNYEKMIVDLAHFVVNFDKNDINRLVESQSWCKEEHLLGFLRPTLKPWRKEGLETQSYMDNKVENIFDEIPLGASVTDIVKNGKRVVVYVSKTFVND